MSMFCPRPTPVPTGASRMPGRTTVLPKKAKPTVMDARFVKSTVRLAAMRRSTSGLAERTSNHPQSRSTTTPPIKQPSVPTLVQPHSLPFETARRMGTRPAARPIAPIQSKPPSLRRVLTGTKRATRTKPMSPRAPATQNSTCQSRYCEITAEIGRPTAPPIPSVALTSATAGPSRFAWSTSRRMLMPSGITPIAIPWRARATMSGTIVDEKAASTEPAIMMPSRTSTIRRLP